MKSLLTLFILCLLGLPRSTVSQILFNNVADQVGINHIYGSTVPGCGVSMVDFTGDGRDDITLGTEAGAPIRFYQNVNGQFVLLPPLVPHQDEVKQILWVDFNNDGNKDLFVTSYEGTNRLYKNTGNLNFIDITVSAGLPLEAFRTFGAAWGDYDRDGLLDLYYSERKMPIVALPNENRLFRNNGDGTFTEVTAQSQTADSGKTPFCSAFFDYNNDKWPDIYIAQDRLKGNSLLKNNGDGTFTDVSEVSQTGLAMDAMCVAIGDYDNDGRSDIYVSNTESGNALFHNLGADVNGEVIFEEVAMEAGVAFYSIGWGSVFLDADNDGDLDLYVSGMPVGTDAISSAFYENAGDGTFFHPNAGFVGDTVSSFSNAIGDIDDNGYPDIMVANAVPFPSQLWRSSGSTQNNWLKIKLQGVLSNRDGIGSKIEVFTGAHYQMRYTHCGIGFMGQNSDTEIIGLGNATVADSIRITWPTGHIDRLTHVPAGQKLLVQEGNSTAGQIEVDPNVSLTIVKTESPIWAPLSATIYPNPSGDFLYINTPDDQFRHFSIFHASGKLVLNGRLESTSTPIHIGHLLQGYYLIVLHHQDGRKLAQKWIKG